MLLNLTEPHVVSGYGSFDITIGGFSSSNTTRLFSFAHEDIRSTHNFTRLFNSAVANNYSSALWDGDVALLIRVFNITSRLTYKVSVVLVMVYDYDYWLLFCHDTKIVFV